MPHVTDSVDSVIFQVDCQLSTGLPSCPERESGQRAVVVLITLFLIHITWITLLALFIDTLDDLNQLGD